MIRYDKTKNYETFELLDMEFCKRAYIFKNPTTELDQNILIPIYRDYQHGNVGIAKEITLEEYDICKSIYKAINVIKLIFVISNAIYLVEDKSKNFLDLDLGEPPTVAIDIIRKTYGDSILYFVAGCRKI